MMEYGSTPFNQFEMRHKVEKSLQRVQQVLDNTRHPVLAADAAHRYVDKMTLAEFLTRSSLSAVFTSLTQLGVSLEQLQTLKQWSGSQAVTLRLRAEEKCRFVREETREVESATSRVTESSLFGKTTSKVVTKVTDYIWEVTIWCVVIHNFPLVLVLALDL
jgi:predicted PP-loop superfamily ATPase